MKVETHMSLWHCGAGPYVTHLSLKHFFDDSSMDFHTFSGWMVVVTNLLNATAAAIILMFVVRLLCTAVL